MPDNWQPTDANRTLATRLGVDLEAAIEQFRDYHLARGSTFVRWDLALNTWIRNDRKYSKNGRSVGADTEQTVADVLLMVNQHAAEFCNLERAVALAGIAQAHPVHWQRSGKYMQHLRLGEISYMAQRDREHEIRVQLRQLEGVVTP
jgi:hypothetical protein